MKIKCFEKWSKFQHGIGYWLGAVQETNHCLNQCWHSSSTHIYVSRRDWIEYFATLWSWWSHNNRNGYVVEVAARVVTGGAEASDGWGGHPGDVSVSLMKSPCIHIYLIQCLNTLRPRQDGCLFADVILKCIFLNLNSWISYKISWKYVAWRLIDNKPSMVQIMGCRWAGDNPIIWTINGIYIAKLGLDELGTVTEAIILTTYTFQWLYRYCIRIYCILCFRNITLIVDLCAYLLLLLSL